MERAMNDERPPELPPVSTVASAPPSISSQVSSADAETPANLSGRPLAAVGSHGFSKAPHIREVGADDFIGTGTGAVPVEEPRQSHASASKPAPDTVIE